MDFDEHLSEFHEISIRYSKLQYFLEISEADTFEKVYTSKVISTLKNVYTFKILYTFTSPPELIASLASDGPEVPLQGTRRPQRIECQRHPGRPTASTVTTRAL